MTTLIERVRKWDEERRQEWLRQGTEQGRAEGFERGRQEGIAFGIPQGIERGRLVGEREFVSRLVARRIGVAAAVYFLPVLNGLSDEERTAAIARLPSRDGFPDITELEERPTPERLVQLAESLAAWVERAGTPELLDRYRLWVTMVMTPQVGLAAGTAPLEVASEADTGIATIVELARTLREELDRQSFNDGIERGRRAGVEEGWIEGIGLGMAQGIEQGWLEVERQLVYRLVSQKFGAAVADRIAAVLDDLSVPSRITAIADVALDCETAEGFMSSSVPIPEG